MTFGISPDTGFHTRGSSRSTTWVSHASHLIRKSAAKKYLVWRQKNNYGQTYWQIERTTFIIDQEGKFARIFPKVQVQGHVEQAPAVLRTMPKLQSIVTPNPNLTANQTNH